jgi:hypothetical protein
MEGEINILIGDLEGRKYLGDKGISAKRGGSLRNRI